MDEKKDWPMHIKVETQDNNVYTHAADDIEFDGVLLTIVERTEAGEIPVEVCYPASNISRFSVREYNKEVGQ